MHTAQPATEITRHTPDEEIAELINQIKQHPQHRQCLLRLLPEQAPFYEGRSTNEIIRLRGYILAAFEKTGVPSGAIPYVLEELENSCEAYLVAGAACAVRGFPEPTPQVVPYLFKAIDNIQLMDDALTFEQYKPEWPLRNYTSALREIFKTFGWLGAYAGCAIAKLEQLYQHPDSDFSDAVKEEIINAIARIKTDTRAVDTSCCIPLAVTETEITPPVPTEAMLNVQLEDQQGNQLMFKEYFCQKPTIVVFFYTRCTNPNKCSLTITKLGYLQKELEAQGLATQIRTAAFTYDAAFDLPFRLHSYGENRGATFNEDNRFFRVPDQFARLQSYFQLGVNYGGATVNKHRLELYILNKNGEIVHTFTRLQWEVQDVVEQAKEVLRKPAASPVTKRSTPRVILANVQSIVPPLLVAFFPKCAFCWAAYLSVFGIAGAQSIPYTPELLPILIVLMSANLVWLYRGAKQRNGLSPFYLSLAGILVILSGLLLEVQVLSLIGIGILFIGSLLNSLSYKVYLKLSSSLQNMLLGKLRIKVQRLFS